MQRKCQKNLTSFFQRNSPPPSCTNNDNIQRNGTGGSPGGCNDIICIASSSEEDADNTREITGQKRRQLSSSTSTISNTKRSTLPISPFFTPRKKQQQEQHQSTRFSTCPLCQKSFPIHNLEIHAENCNGGTTDLVTQEIEDGISNETKQRKRNVVTTTTKTKNYVQLSYKNKKKKEETNSTRGVLQGLSLYEDFITEEEEEAILKGMNDDDKNNPWRESRFNGKHVGKRWGVHCSLRDRKVYDEDIPLPQFMTEIIFPKLNTLIATTRTSLKSFHPNEGNAIEYQRRLGHYLKSHVDDRQLSKEIIANLSLGGDCYMTFRNEKRRKQENSTSRDEDDSVQKVLLKRRTLQIITGKARYDYSHGIENKDLLSDRRVSITIRESPVT